MHYTKLTLYSQKIPITTSGAKGKFCFSKLFIHSFAVSFASEKSCNKEKKKMMFPSIRLIHSPHSTHFSKSLFRGKKSSFTGSFQMSDLHSVINLKKGRRSHPNQFLERKVLKILKIISIWRSHRGLNLMKFVREMFLSTL